MHLLHSKKNIDIYRELSEYVRGHDYAKKVLINLINRSKTRYYQRWGLLQKEENLIATHNCLLIGDSGTGKTHLIESLSKIMFFPFITIDATDLNPTGASGGIKTKDLMRKITNKAQEYTEEAPSVYRSIDGVLEQMVVFVDEVDKLGQKLSSEWNEHVQANFLTMFENKHELSGITYIFAGAFSGLEKYSKDTKTSIGFINEEKTSKPIKDLAQKIIEFGLMPEFVGRMHNIVLLDKLTEEDYTYILNNKILPKANLDLSFYKKAKLKLNDSEIKNIVSAAMNSGLGVRALQSEVNRLMVDIEFNSL